MFKSAKIYASVALLLAASGSVYSSSINFDDQGLSGPSLFPFTSGSPLNITVDGITATFSGGVILNKTTNLPANQTSVYGTVNIPNYTTGYTNPLTISFSKAVDNVIFDLLNGWTSTTNFRVTDDAGDSQSYSLLSNLNSGMTTLGLVAHSISSITIADITQITNWDFFVDNIRFNVAATCNDRECKETSVPEPGSLALLGLGFAGLALGRRRK